jgi:RHS repeat-associated protein
VVEQACSGLPFGDSLDCTNSVQFPTEQHFTGKERDSESGNDYFGARYYGSSMGRFMSPDFNEDGDEIQPVPYANLEDPQGLNQYAYAGNNPLTFADPDGHSKDCGGGGDPSVVCLVTSFWDWLTSGSKDGGSNNGDTAPPPPDHPTPAMRRNCNIDHSKFLGCSSYIHNPSTNPEIL